MPFIRFHPARRAARRAAWLGLSLILPAAGAAGAPPVAGPVPPAADPATAVPVPTYRSAFGPAEDGVETGRTDWLAANAAVATAAHPQAAHREAAPAGSVAPGHGHGYPPPAAAVAPLAPSEPSAGGGTR